MTTKKNHKSIKISDSNCNNNPPFSPHPPSCGGIPKRRCQHDQSTNFISDSSHRTFSVKISPKKMTPFVLLHLLALLCCPVSSQDLPNCDAYWWPDVKTKNYFYVCSFFSLSSYDFSGMDGDKTAVISFTCSDFLMNQTLQSGKFHHLHKLEELQIDRCNIFQIEPGAFQGLTSLTSLIIEPAEPKRTRIQIDPSIFDSTPNLTKIEIALGIPSIPARILCKLKHLVHLDWSGNNLEYLDRIGCGVNNSCCNRLLVLGMADNRVTSLQQHHLLFPELEVLALTRNDVTTIQNGALGHLENLRYIGLQSNKLDRIEPNFFEKNKLLAEIDLSDNNLTFLPLNIFHNLTSLQYLHLSRNRLAFNQTNFSVFSGLNSLVHLNLTDNKIQFLPSLDHLTSLNNLSLANNLLSRITDNDFRFLSALETLNVSNNNLINISQNAFLPLKSLGELDLSHNRLESIPELKNSPELIVVNLDFNHIDKMAAASFSGLGRLLGLNLRGNRLKTIKNGTFEHASKLYVINLGSNEISEIEAGSFDGLENLHYLVLSNNKIRTMDRLFLPVKMALNLADNQIEVFDFENVGKSLETVDVRRNRIRRIVPVRETHEYRLKHFYASDNKIQIFAILHFPLSVEIVDLSRNNVSIIHQFSLFIYPKLTHVDLSENSIAEISFSDIHYTFPGIPAQQPIPEVNLQGNPLLCSCANDWLIEALRTTNRLYPKFNGVFYCAPIYTRIRKLFPSLYLPDLTTENMLCSWPTDCPALCKCFRNRNRNNYIVDCYGASWVKPFPTIPGDTTTIFLDGNRNLEFAGDMLANLSNLTSLYMNSSGLTSIDGFFEGVPRLKVLHLERNNLSAINGNEFRFTTELEKLFLHQNKLQFLSPDAFRNLTRLRTLTVHENELSQPQFWEFGHHLPEITLGGNPFDCDCEFVIPFQHWVVQSSNTYFKDLSDAYCNDDFPPIMQYNNSRCYEERKTDKVVVVIVPTVTMFVLLTVLLVLSYLYRLEMKVWLYSRYGVRLFNRDKDTDSGKTYDAFISYANEDDEWVADELVPQLKDYKLCLHQIDFLVGEFIADSIVNAVENSSRTVIILTPNYVKSDWCRFEFDSAHVQSLRDRCKRLVVVILEDVENKELDKNLRAYLKTNTYLDRKDALFWKKLKYALPDLTSNEGQAETNV